MQELEAAAHEVELYESHIEQITSVHHDCSARIDWTALRNRPEPIDPIRLAHHETAARKRRDEYRPGLFDKLFRRVEKRRQKLERAVAEASQLDEKEYHTALESHGAAHAEWQETKALAERILFGEPEAFADAIEALAPFEELSALKSRVTLRFTHDWRVEAVLHIQGEDVVPTEVRSLLKSGKLSVKKMPQGQFYELYQDYVAGAVLRVARELFAILPLRAATIHVQSRMLNSSTGYLEDQTILSVLIPRATLEMLNFNALDPSDGLKNFRHQVDFKRTRGFLPVPPLSLEVQAT